MPDHERLKNPPKRIAGFQQQRTVKSKDRGRDKLLCLAKNIWYCKGHYAIILKNV